MESMRARVVLELDPAADPPAGSFLGPGGREREFSGWLELAALLENCRVELSREADAAPLGGASRERSPRGR
jgi:hypothetical protein